MQLHISLGNSKLGKIPNISLPAIITCPEGVPCAKECYCNSKVFYWERAREKWRENFELYQTDPLSYFLQLQNFLEKKKPDYFRWHISGDVPDLEYRNYMISLIEKFPDTLFLMFTKRYNWDFFEKELDNFKVKYSAWYFKTGGVLHYTVPPKTPIAWLFREGDEVKDLPIKENAFVCKGKCNSCFYCWQNDKDVILPKH